MIASCEQCEEKQIVDSYTGQVTAIACGLDPWAICAENVCAHRLPGYVSAFKLALGRNCLLFSSCSCGQNCECHPFAASAFIRDNFLAYTSRGGKYHLVAGKEVEDSFLESFRHHSQFSSVVKSRFSFEGGNILVGEGFVILSRDILLDNFSDSTLMRDICGSHCSNMNDSIERFEEAISNELFNHRKIIWYGELKKHCLLGGRNYYKSTMPMYHLDVSIAVAGKEMNSDSLIVFTASVPEFEISYCGNNDDTGSVGRNDSLLAKYINNVNVQLQSDFKSKMNMKIKLIEIPVIWDRNRSDYYSLLNGIVENKGGVRSFHIPPLPNFLSCDSNDALMNQLQIAEIFSRTQFLFSQDAYINGGGLHCLSLELQRTKDN